MPVRSEAEIRKRIKHLEEEWRKALKWSDKSMAFELDARADELRRALRKRGK